MLDLARADAERQRTERAVGRRVAVAADDGHAGQRETPFRPDDVHDPLAWVAAAVQADAELLAVAGQRVHLRSRDRIRERLVERRGRHVVVHRGDGEVGPADLATVEPQAVERLRRGHLVDEVEIDIEEVWLALSSAHDMAFPHLVRQGLGSAVGAHGLILPRLLACFSPSSPVEVLQGMQPFTGV